MRVILSKAKNLKISLKTSSSLVHALILLILVFSLESIRSHFLFCFKGLLEMYQWLNENQLRTVIFLNESFNLAHSMFSYSPGQIIRHSWIKRRLGLIGENIDGVVRHKKYDSSLRSE